MDLLAQLEDFTKNISSAPTLENMPRRTLADKGIFGPTGAHVIEEVHTPFNLAYITVTTGSTAFQNIVGVTKNEIPNKIDAAQKALILSGVKKGEHILFAYPPLVNLFPKEALEDYGVSWSFLKCSSRDALILAMCKEKPNVVIGESSFLRASLEDARKMQILNEMPKNIIFIAAGTPLDIELDSTVNSTIGGKIHDLYGCQEFGWLTLDGIELREDIVLMPTENPENCDLIVGGLPTGDCFPVLDSGHCCNNLGKIITYSRVRSDDELETVVLQTTASSKSTIDRLARTILRIKAKIVRVSPEIILGADKTILAIKSYNNPNYKIILDSELQTEMFDSLLCAQLDYQDQNKTDPTWIKRR